ncbi:MAG: potassium channel protein [Desulfobacterales bacterium]|nr:potassium channel protein [Desulfobacterales bacterium]MBF0397068.1 potassium channel protein [Desulfobacterales bacterium]
MEYPKNLLISLLLAVLIIVIGTAGYMFIENWGLIDSIYMTVSTLATVGYGEIHPLSQIGRIFSIFLMFFGVGLFLYATGSTFQFMLEGRIRIIMGRRRLENKIKLLKNHYIVCGYGRIGRVLCQKLKRKPVEIVVIEKNPDLIQSMDEDGILYINGEAIHESILIKAGIDKAKGLIAVLSTDVDNVFLVLTARQLNPNLFIIARSCQIDSKPKLMAAGANIVESPYEMGATSIANRVLRPAVTNFIDLAFADIRQDIQMEEIPVHSSSKMVNSTLKDSGIRKDFNLIILAIKQKEGTMIFNPSFETAICKGDTLIAIGDVENLQKLEKVLNP